MARRNLLRTAEGAWYSNYDGYPSRNHLYHSDGRGYPALDSFSDRERERDLYVRNAMTEYERGAGLGGRPPLFDRSQHDVDNADRNDYIGVGGGAGGRGGANKPREWDPSYETFGYNSLRDGVQGNGQRSEWEVEWEPPEHFSPRKTTYDPSFHQAPASPKRVPPWERDRGGYGTPREDGAGQGRLEGYQGQDRFEGQGQVRFEIQSPDRGEGRRLDEKFAKGLDPRVGKVLSLIHI